MGLFSRFENKAEDVIEGSGGSRRGGIEPVKLAKRAFKEMEREKMVGVGHEYAPTLYNILVSAEDDERMNGFYPSLAGEIETYLTSRAEQTGLVFDCPPLVRFIVDEGLKRGKFDIIAESVSPAIISELRHEEMVHYGLEDDTPEPQPEPFYGDGDGYIQADPPAYQEPPRRQEPAPAASAPAYHYEQPEAPRGYEESVRQNYGQSADASPEPAPAPAGEPASHVPPQQDAAVHQAPQPAREQPAPSAGETVMIDEPIPRRRVAILYNYATRQHFKLLTDRTTIGRETTCDVVISDPSVSRRHAEILHGANGWLIRDTGSTNGTSVNGTSTTQSRIYNGDIINLGNTQLEFQED